MVLKDMIQVKLPEHKPKAKKLAQTLDLIEQKCPMVRQVLAKAQQKGYVVQFGKTGSYWIGGEVLTDVKTITINEDRPFGIGDLAHVLCHEGVHAATEDDGNSAVEEALSQVMGVHCRTQLAPKERFEFTTHLQGLSLSAVYKKEYAIYKNLFAKARLTLDTQVSNPIVASLKAMGIDEVGKVPLETYVALIK
jgi:hypothetical protein